MRNLIQLLNNNFWINNDKEKRFLILLFEAVQWLGIILRYLQRFRGEKCNVFAHVLEHDIVITGS